MLNSPFVRFARRRCSSGCGCRASAVEEIDQFCRSEPLHSRVDPDGPAFYQSQITRGHTPTAGPHRSGRSPIRCAAPGGSRRGRGPGLARDCPLYLRFDPHQVMPLLCWSFASDFTDDERRRLKHHVIDYHYDVGGFDFVYASFYILDTDRHSGAHVMMKRSHDRKPLRMLLGSAVASEEHVWRHFGRENEIMIEGPAARDSCRTLPAITMHAANEKGPNHVPDPIRLMLLRLATGVFVSLDHHCTSCRSPSSSDTFALKPI